MELTVFETTIEIDETLVDATPNEIQAQVDEYAKGERREFDLAIARPDGFLGDAMAAMDAIPYGETRTYGELASSLDTSAIAVGGACARNPVPLVVPCHRVLASDGGLGGYSGGDGVATKRVLLDLEASNVDGATVQTTLAGDH